MMTRTLNWLLVFVLLSGSTSAAKATLDESTQKGDAATKPLSNSFISNSRFFFDSVLAAKNANAISAELPGVQHEQAEAAFRKQELEMVALMEKSISDGRMVTDAFLEGLHPRLKNVFRDSLMLGQVKYLEGLRKTDPAMQALAIETMMVWGEFWTSNSAQIIDKLDLADNVPPKTGVSAKALLALKYGLLASLTAICGAFFVIWIVCALAALVGTRSFKGGFLLLIYLLCALIFLVPVYFTFNHVVSLHHEGVRKFYYVMTAFFFLVVIVRRAAIPQFLRIAKIQIASWNSGVEARS